jgi:hypothetical protein
MRKEVVGAIFTFLSVFSFSSNDGLGIVSAEDFLKAGVSKENVKRAQGVLSNTSNKYKVLLLDKQKVEIEINQMIILGVEKHWDEIDKLADKLGNIEAEMIKDRLRGQVEMQKYITQEQYFKAREIAVERLQK